MNHQLTAADWFESQLRAHGDPTRAVNEAAYLKLEQPFTGTGVPATRAIVKQWLKEFDPDRRGLLEVVDALWRLAPFECRMVAMMLLVLREQQLRTGDLDLVERLIRQAKTWALSDDLSSHVAGPLVVRDPSGSSSVLDRWSVDDDFWIRRASLLSLRPSLRSGAEWDRFVRYADSMLDEKEFFIRKAIGWVLREVGKRNPELVEHFVEPRTPRISGVTIREAVKPLAPEVRERLLAAYQDVRRLGPPQRPEARATPALRAGAVATARRR